MKEDVLYAKNRLEKGVWRSKLYVHVGPVYSSLS